MRLHRFIGNYDFGKKTVEIIDKNTIKQIINVLRLKCGDMVILSNGKGMSGEIKLDSISSTLVSGTIIKTKNEDSNKKFVTLYLSILKKENFELASQKAVEAGISRIVPVITDRTIKTGLNIKRLEKIILEASEQCGRGSVPVLSPILDFKEAIEDGRRSEEKIIFHFVKENYIPNKETKSASIFIGPEGGFTDKEIEEAVKSGYTVSSLGSLVLRAETAAIISTYRCVNNV